MSGQCFRAYRVPDSLRSTTPDGNPRFSAPKSVSLAALGGGDERCRRRTGEPARGSRRDRALHAGADRQPPCPGDNRQVLPSDPRGRQHDTARKTRCPRTTIWTADARHFPAALALVGPGDLMAHNYDRTADDITLAEGERIAICGLGSMYQP